MPGHVGQTSTPPHPSGSVPHFAPTESHVFCLHPQWLATPAPPHVSGGVHIPQLSVEPQPFDAVPQLNPSAAHVVGVHIPAPHLLAPPTPHTSVPVHIPQSSMPPHPSG